MFSWPGISVDALEPSDVWPLGDAGAQALTISRSATWSVWTIMNIQEKIRVQQVG